MVGEAGDGSAQVAVAAPPRGLPPGPAVCVGDAAPDVVTHDVRTAIGGRRFPGDDESAGAGRGGHVGGRARRHRHAAHVGWRPRAGAGVVVGPDLDVVADAESQAREIVGVRARGLGVRDLRPVLGGLVRGVAADVAQVVGGDSRGPRVARRAPRDQQRVGVGRPGRGRGRAWLPAEAIELDAEAPERPAVVGKFVRDMQLPGANRAFAQVLRGTEAKRSVPAHGPAIVVVHLPGVCQQGRGARGGLELDLQVTEAVVVDLGGDLHELDEIDAALGDRDGARVRCVDDGGEPCRARPLHLVGALVRHIGPVRGEVDRRAGVDHAEAVLVVERVVVRVGAVLQRAVLPVAVGRIVLACGGGQDQLHVAPREQGVGGLDQRHDAGHDRRSRGGTTEVAPVQSRREVRAVAKGVEQRGGLCGRDERTIPVGRGADPEVGARLGVAALLAAMVDRADGRDTVKVRVAVEVGVVQRVSVRVSAVAGGPDVGDAPAAVPFPQPRLDRRLPGSFGGVRRAIIQESPAVGRHLRAHPVAGHRIHQVAELRLARRQPVDEVVAVDRRSGRHAPDTDLVMLSGDQPGDGRSMVHPEEL